jgi:uncharacterized protein
MIAPIRTVFVDTSFLVAVVHDRDEHHERAQSWSDRVDRLLTTRAVLTETAGGLCRPDWRPHVVRLIDHLMDREDVEIVEVDLNLFMRGWRLFRERMDKSWSLVDCISFIVMEDNRLHEALTADHHFEQAGFRALLLDEPS